MRLLFSTTLFLSALLLFLVQPMIGKMLMPLAGGTAAVWSTCIVFFQTALLGGYVYAHAGSKNGPRRFAGTHVVLLFLPIIALFAVAVAAHSSDDLLWREQIARPVSAMVTLAPAAHSTSERSANQLWREQVAAPAATLVYVARTIDVAGPPEHALWREQHKGTRVSTVDKSTRIVSGSRDR